MDMMMSESEVMVVKAAAASSEYFLSTLEQSSGVNTAADC
jgi:hypothetical protein